MQCVNIRKRICVSKFKLEQYLLDDVGMYAILREVVSSGEDRMDLCGQVY